MAKTTTLYVRLETGLKEQAELVRIEKGILNLDEIPERFQVLKRQGTAKWFSRL